MKVEEIAPTNFVTDYTNTLTQDEINLLSEKLKNLKENNLSSETGKKVENLEIAVVVVPDMGGDYLEHFAVKLYERLGLGGAGRVNSNGMLWLISKDERQMRMEVGYGLESTLTDGITKNIQDNFVRPEFKNGNYFQGINVGLDKVNTVLGGGSLPENSSEDLSSYSVDWFTIFIFIIVFGINIFAWLFAIVARTKSWWLGGVAGFILSAPIFYFILGLTVTSLFSVVVLTLLGLFFDYKISKNYLYWKNKIPINVNGTDWDTGKPAWWAGGSWGPGGSSRGGGFGGFSGGGFSGGGGSSSSW